MKLIIVLILAFAFGFNLGDIVGRYKEWKENNDKNKNYNVHN